MMKNKLEKNGIKFLNADLTYAEEISNIEKECFCDSWSLKTIKADISSEKTVWLAALSGSETVGYACAMCVLDEAELNRIAVKSSYRRMGIAKNLLENIISACKTAGCKKMYLEVREGNRAATALYKRAGFNETGVRKNYYANPLENAVTMALEL